ncbi:MAG: tRNA (adenosine(37)-N6)-threonylcarbamoyltransferase complex transferase subunit TsaD [Candidatus Levyibacteriota bacterium]
MTILGIETSCDETAAAVIEGEGTKLNLLSNVIASSLELHTKTGGIIPEQAAREQVKYMLPVLKQAVKEANTTLDAIDAFAVTYGPGLIGSLLVGVETAKTLAYTLNKPIVPVNHMVGHLYANFIDNDSIEFPALGLVVSGGHTDLLLIKGHGDLQLLGGTRDDAAGECYDKCARLLGYNYPGGPKISKLAEKGNSDAFDFPRPMLGSHDYEFSFSGLKTAFLNQTKKLFPVLRNAHAHEKIGWQEIVMENDLSEKEKQLVYDLCASLQKAIITVLVRKTLRAAQQYDVSSIMISGGVAADILLRETFQKTLQEKKLPIKFSVPPKYLCTDNAAMIASAAYFNFKPVPWSEITADPELYF